MIQYDPFGNKIDGFGNRIHDFGSNGSASGQGLHPLVVVVGAIAIFGAVMGNSGGGGGSGVVGGAGTNGHDNGIPRPSNAQHFDDASRAPKVKFDSVAILPPDGNYIRQICNNDACMVGLMEAFNRKYSDNPIRILDCVYTPADSWGGPTMHAWFIRVPEVTPKAVKTYGHKAVLGCPPSLG